MKIIFLGGTIACSYNEAQQLVPQLNLTSLFALIDGAGLKIKFKQYFSTYCPYVQDSQEFDLIENGSKIVEILNCDKGDDFLIITGTDTLKWLSKLIVSNNLAPNRKIILLSSMYDAHSNPNHIGHLLYLALSFFEDKICKDGVYVFSAQDYHAKKINIYNGAGRITKISCSGHSAVIGEEISYQAVMQEGKFRLNVIKEQSSFVSFSNSNLSNFIGQGKMKLLPILPNNSPKNIFKYYQNLSKGDIAVIEICKSDLENPQFLQKINELANLEIKIILFNRGYFNPLENAFLPLINEQWLELNKQLFDHQNIFITSLNSDFYIQIAFGEIKDFLFDQSNHQTPSRLALRYVPNFTIFYNSSIFMENCPTILEGLAGAVMPQKLLQKFHDQQKTLKLSLHPTYCQKEAVNSIYASSANQQFLEDIGVTSNPQQSALDASQSQGLSCRLEMPDILGNKPTFYLSKL